MAQIKINDISLAGSDLFSDSESYLTELSHDSEMLNIQGGTSVRLTTSIRTTLFTTYPIPAPTLPIVQAA
ncbi:hypothetical protein [Aphanothece sacrum]|uniref:Uncharacterized protein n=1 Tax=Aphanothece sacrum FPU1 TaxID=1920663 RepID=A0A401IHD8_APHSA|nr:hypothetical protein [Aphanothece sacrum]GBF80654.1 hypothetical protein AsFPU1_2058 [Aphanothece sacrum FPU1]GBF83148.1 hypothetical protein AsFPU3_0187 [Aphanothece sacrum FPU3]